MNMSKRIPILLSLLLLPFSCSDDSTENRTDVGVETGTDVGGDAFDEPDGDVAETGTGTGILGEGCPVSGQAMASAITDSEASLDGPSALGGAGDYLLMNEQAAFVVQGVDFVKTYWYYGGNLIDAVPLDDCAQTGPETYDELAFILGQAELAQFERSTLRGFRGDSVEILSDGSDGEEARIRVSGTDDYFWLVEYTLILEAFDNGNPKPLSEPFGIETWVDYVLEPDSPVLRMELGVRNLTDEPLPILLGAVNWFADETSTRIFWSQELDFGGMNINMGVPWLVATNGDGAWALSILERNAGTIRIAGVDAWLDVDQFVISYPLGASGAEDDTRIETFFFSVGEGGMNTAIRHLHAFNPRPMPGPEYNLYHLSGSVIDAGDGAPIAEAVVTLEMKNADDEWHVLDDMVTNAEGTFEGEVADYSGREYRLSTTLQGRPVPDTVEGSLADVDETVFEVDHGGTLRLDVRDGEGRGLPAKVYLWQGSGVAQMFFTTGVVTDHPVQPGVYEVSISRGFEYSLYNEEIEITADEIVEIEATLEHLVDTDGFLSVDAHVHAGPSPDSAIPIPLRITTLAAEGLDIVISTDHEALIDWSWGVDETGLGDWIATSLGEEITPPLWHHNAYFFEEDSNAPRGGAVDHWGLDMAELHAAARDRGAQVVQMNHPRGVFEMIGLDPMTGEATLDDPTLIGLEPDAVIWSWDFDTVEYMNGHRSPFGENQMFEWWTSFLNHGHRVTAVGTTDVHGLVAGGSPRTYFESPTDLPAEFDDQMVIDALLSGRAIVSAGAFARVSINDDAGLGQTESDTDGEVDLWVHIEAIEEIDVTHFMVFVNCSEVLTVDTTDPDGIVKYDGTVTVPVGTDAHVIVAGFGQNAMPRNLPQYNGTQTPRFTTNPIYVDVDGNGVYDPPGGLECEYDL